jgi:hypothetical protein
LPSEPVIQDAKRKAIELETLDVDNTEAGAKKFAKIEEAMMAFTELPIKSMSATEIRPHLSTIFHVDVDA